MSKGETAKKQTLGAWHPHASCITAAQNLPYTACHDCIMFIQYPLARDGYNSDGTITPPPAGYCLRIRGIKATEPRNSDQRSWLDSKNTPNAKRIHAIHGYVVVVMV